MSDGTSVTLVPGFQTAFKLRAVPRAELSLDPPQDADLAQRVVQLELSGSCQNLPDGVICDVTLLVEDGSSSRHRRVVAALSVDGQSCTLSLELDVLAAGLVGQGSLEIEVAPRFPHCEPARIEPGALQFDNQIRLEASRTSGCKVGDLVELTPVATGAFAEGVLVAQLYDSVSGEGETTDVGTEVQWLDGDRAAQPWRVGCATAEGPVALGYRALGASAFDIGCRLYHLTGSGDPEPVWDEPQLVTGLPMPKLESLSHSLSAMIHSVSGRISGFADGLEVPLYLAAAVRDGFGSESEEPRRWYKVRCELDDDGSFSKSFALPWDAFHADELVGLACAGIHPDEPLAAVIDYDTSRVTPIGTDSMPPHAGCKTTAPAVAIGEVAGAEVRTEPQDLNEQVLAVANSKSGGGYRWESDYDGTPEDFVWQGQTILRAAGGESYCCGFTAWVALKVAAEAGLLEGVTAAQLRTFKRQMFGACRDASVKKKMPAVAFPALGIGIEVPFWEAKPGDFLQIWRPNDTGHSVIFLGWETNDAGEKVKVRFRGSNGSTDGVADKSETISTTGTWRCDPTQSYVARMQIAPTRQRPAGGSCQWPDYCELTFRTEGGHLPVVKRVHWPGGVSGVTIGPGYDMKERSAAEVERDLVAAGVPEADARQLAGGAGKGGSEAGDWVDANKSSLPSISDDASRGLFGHVYPRYVEKARDIVQSWGGDWEALPQCMQEVLVDLRYRGDLHTGHSAMADAVKESDFEAFKQAIQDYDYWQENCNLPETNGGPNGRFTARGEWLDEHAPS